MANYPQKTRIKADILVVGGGLAGLTQALLLARRGLDVVCIDREDPARQTHPAFDGRTVAISYGARSVLAEAGIWDGLAATGCAITTIHILEGGGSPLLVFDSQEIQAEAFGWIVENLDLRRSLFASAKVQKGLRHIAPAEIATLTSDEATVTATLNDGREYSAALLIGADGRNSYVRDWLGIETRRRDYGQQALVCTFHHSQPHGHIAIEDFRSEGPLAVLPMTNAGDGAVRSALVWSAHGKTHPFMRAEGALFRAALQARLPDFYGTVGHIGPRFAFPLSLGHARAYTGHRAVLIADAAHGIHPIAGQGLNIGLRDVAALADLIAEAHQAGADIGNEKLLNAYRRTRRADNTGMVAATDLLNGLFSNDFLPLKLARRTGLRAVSKLAPARRFFMRQAMGGG